MYQIETDPHTHTIASGHAFSTIEENVRYAAEVGITAIGMTDHYGEMFTPAHPSGIPFFTAFQNMPSLPSVIHGVRILAGVEIDIVDIEGHLYGWNIELPHRKGHNYCDFTLATRELTIASVHYMDKTNITMAQGTRMYCNVLRTPGVHVIGHPGRAGVPFDVKEVMQTAKETGKFIEINAHSFDFGQEVRDRCREIALAAMHYEVPVVVSSDAHSAYFIGHFDGATSMLASIGFPQELIANRTLDTLLAGLSNADTKCGRKRQV